MDEYTINNNIDEHLINYILQQENKKNMSLFNFKTRKIHPSHMCGIQFGTYLLAPYKYGHYSV